MTGRLDGKVAIITGASSGLGPVMGSLFVAEGARVLLAARREELVREAANAAGPGAIAMRADVTNEDDVAAMVARAVDEFGHVDILCNNAAAPGQDRWVWEQTLDNWNDTIAIDVTAAMLCTREVLNQSMLQRRSGVILNFSSTVSYAGMVRKTHYVTAKASLRAFTKAVALEVVPHGIRCNCIVPGAIDTDLFRKWVQRTADEQGGDAAAVRAKYLKGVALQDISSPEDVANLALFLAGDESRTITGQSVPVDAGGICRDEDQVEGDPSAGHPRDGGGRHGRVARHGHRRAGMRRAIDMPDAPAGRRRQSCLPLRRRLAGHYIGCGDRGVVLP